MTPAQEQKINDALLSVASKVATVAADAAARGYDSRPLLVNAAGLAAVAAGRSLRLHKQELQRQEAAKR